MGERNVNNVLEIIKNDFKSAFSNPIVTIILVGLIILPSLYALIIDTDIIFILQSFLNQCRLSDFSFSINHDRRARSR